MRVFILLILMLLPAGAMADLREVRLADGRFYLFDRPAGQGPAPLIVALHGGGGNPAQFARSSGLAQAAVRAGFAIAFPAGSARRQERMLTWNAGYCCGWAAETGVDDPGFLDRVVADAAQRFGATGPVFVTGMSNGAMMAQTWATRRAAKVAGVATVSGTMDAAHLRVAAPVPFLHIHGDADRMVPFAGGVGDSSLTRTDFAAVADVLADFRRPFGAMAKASSQTSAGGYRFLRTVWSRGGRARVVLIEIGGGAHEWPGGRRADDQAMSATEEVIAFFRAQLD